MKTLKYLNKRIFVCLSLVVLFLIVASFVAGSAEDQQECDEKHIAFRQNPTGMVTTGTPINFSWDITKEPSTCFEGMPYYLEIKDNNNKRRYYNTFKIPSGSCNIFSNNDSWVVREDEPNGSHISYLTIPGFGGSHLDFEVVETLLVIQKYNDTNQNNKVDVGVDERLQGWEFQVTDPDKNTSTHFTDVNKEKRIKVRDEYAGKEFTVKEILQPGWRAVLPINQTVTVPKGETKTVQFLNKKINTTILIQKFNDTNRNYEIDYGDEKLRDWKFNVTNPAGETRLYKTDAYGERLIDILDGKEGDYKIAEIIKEPDKWKPIKIDTDKTATILDQGEQWIKIRVEEGKESKVRFLNYHFKKTLVISKFYDHNLNGKRDGREEGLENWEFEIKFPDGSVKNVPTEPDGRIIIDNPPIGTYTITELTTKPCWKNSSPIVRDVEITPDRGAEVEFGNYEVGNLTIYKFNDTNHNGVWDAGEVPLPNWGFKVKGPNGVIDITRYTDENGGSSVELPANRRYSVSETIPVGWRNSTPHTQSVYIKPCEDALVTFGNYRDTRIIIHKFNDTNGNGIRDSDEQGLAGWDFWISGPNVNEIFTTDENGWVRYEDAIPGQYRIEERPREDQRNEWKITTPPRTKEVVVEEGQKVKVEFGNAIICRCDEIYPLPELAPRWHNNSDENLVVSKYVDPRILHCDNPNPNEGEIINVTLRVSAFAGMPPTDLVIAVDTSGSLFECSSGRAVLEDISEGITEYIANNEAKFGENVRIGLVSWDEDIDEIVNLTTDYSNVTAACKRLSINAEEDTLYPVGLNGSLEVFSRSPRENVTKMIVFITDARGTTDGLSNYSRLPDTSGYIIHAITVCTEQDSDNFKMLVNFTSQHSGFVRRVSESSDELAKELTTLTVSGIERRILNNVTVIETLPKYLRVLNWTYRIPPTSPEHINRDGIDWSTETMVWDIGELSSDQCWENTFQAIFCCRMPADETHPVGIPKKTSEVTYSDPTNSSITKHMLIPEGGIWIQPRPWWERVPVWLWALLGAMAIAIIALAIYCFRRTPKQET